jgi:hypothetical protein
MVYFWAQGDDPVQSAELIIAGCQEHLANIPGVLRLEAGRPAGTARDVVDNSYAVGLLVEFADAAAQDVYQDHPDHHRFIAECSRYWSRVQVYDTRLQ